MNGRPMMNGFPVTDGLPSSPQAPVASGRQRVAPPSGKAGGSLAARGRRTSARGRRTSARGRRVPMASLPDKADGERGNMIVMGIAAWLALVVIVLGIVSLSLIYLERRELLAQADAIALEAASGLDEGYFTDGTLAPRSSSEIRSVASKAVDGRTSLAEPTGVEDGAVVISLRRTVNVRFLPISGIDIEVTSRSSLQRYEGQP